MRCHNRVVVFLLPALLLCSLSASAYAPQLDSLLQVLDEAIRHHQRFARQREAQIDSVRRQLQVSRLTAYEKYRLHEQLYELYDPYICDSAIVSLSRCIDLATPCTVRACRRQAASVWLISWAPRACT